MDKLSQLLHELIDHAVPQGNRRGELHGLVDELAAEDADSISRPPANEPATLKPSLAVPFAPPAKPSGTQAV